MGPYRRDGRPKWITRVVTVGTVGAVVVVVGGVVVDDMAGFQMVTTQVPTPIRIHKGAVKWQRVEQNRFGLPPKPPCSVPQVLFAVITP